MARLSVALMAHRRRAELVGPLVEQIDADVEVVWDRRDDRWDTGRRALLAHDPDATHHLVVQDDAIVCADLVAGIARALGRVDPEAPVCLYLARRNIRKQALANRLSAHAWHLARRQGAGARVRWVIAPGPIWGVGIVVPTGHIGELVDYCDRLPIPNYDSRIKRFYAARRVACWYPLPSLVDHRSGPEHPSLVEGRSSQRRVAQWFAGGSALSLDYSGPVDRIEP